ncbi:MAG: hypothetical protein V7K50_08100 [Nostoc sp.]|uniref:hypothetical protein n=1 Tax=Nostoc sp. TaxID=1180 RepID=UPI002FF5AABB
MSTTVTERLALSVRVASRREVERSRSAGYSPSRQASWLKGYLVIFSRVTALYLSVHVSVIFTPSEQIA